MKSKKNILLAAALTSLTVGAAPAATIISYSGATIANSTDTSWVTPAGSTSVIAFDMGGTGAGFGGVNWRTTYPAASGNNDTAFTMNFHAPGQSWASNAGVFYSSPTASVLLDTGNYSGNTANGVDFRIDLSGFTVGQEYLVQFVVADARGGGAIGRGIDINGYSSNISGQNSGNYQYAFGDDRYEVVTAQFTPAAGDTTFSFRPVISDGSGLQVNGIQVLTIPEPSASLLGGVGLLALLRRRRA